MASTASNISKPEKPVSVIWGCELTEQKKEYTFKVLDEKYENQLAVRNVCLGDKAKDEFHILEIIYESPDAEPVTIATLKPSTLPMASMMGIELTPPVTFRLKAGSGPLYVSCQHIKLLDDDYSWQYDDDDEEEEDAVEEEEDEEEEEDTQSPPKPVKRPAGSKKASQAKKKKVEKDAKEDKEEDEKSEESPVKKGKGAGRGRKPAAKK